MQVQLPSHGSVRRAPAGMQAQDCVGAREAARVEPQVALGRHLMAQPVVLPVVAPHQHLLQRNGHLRDARPRRQPSETLRNSFGSS